MTKRIIIIAGPNGAGKTTTALSMTSEPNVIYEYINADEIARGLAPLHPESVSLIASKLMIRRMRELLASQQNLAFETTGSGTNYVKYLKESKVLGYEIYLIFLWLSSPELAISRVAKRVEQGGHHIPAETIRRRYYLGIKNLIKYYLPISDNALLLNNSEGQSNKIIANKSINDCLHIENMVLWKEIQRIANG